MCCCTGLFAAEAADGGLGGGIGCGEVAHALLPHFVGGVVVLLCLSAKSMSAGSDAVVVPVVLFGPGKVLLEGHPRLGGALLGGEVGLFVGLGSLYAGESCVCNLAAGERRAGKLRVFGAVLHAFDEARYSSICLPRRRKTF